MVSKVWISRLLTTHTRAYLRLHTPASWRCKGSPRSRTPWACWSGGPWWGGSTWLCSWLDRRAEDDAGPTLAQHTSANDKHHTTHTCQHTSPSKPQTSCPGTEHSRYTRLRTTNIRRHTHVSIRHPLNHKRAVQGLNTCVIHVCKRQTSYDTSVRICRTATQCSHSARLPNNRHIPSHNWRVRSGARRFYKFLVGQILLSSTPYKVQTHQTDRQTPQTDRHKRHGAF